MKGQIWISAVLYIAIGVVVISLLLTAMVPLIEKMKDRNTVVQTKELLITVDETIKTVSKEGPGSQRGLSPFSIKAGQIVIDEDNDAISWSMDTTGTMIEPDVIIKEGVLTMLLASTPVTDKYRISVNLTYKNTIDLTLVSNYQNPFAGRYSVSVRHTGNFTPGPVTDKPVIELVIR
jgi:hypothetical protein